MLILPSGIMYSIVYFFTHLQKIVHYCKQFSKSHMVDNILWLVYFTSVPKKITCFILKYIKNLC